MPDKGEGLATIEQLNAAASILEGWDAYGIGAGNKPKAFLGFGEAPKLLRKAADRISALEAEVERLTREAQKWESRFWRMDANFDRAVARAETAEAALHSIRQD